MKMQRILSAILAMVMICSMAVIPTYAADENAVVTIAADAAEVQGLIVSDDADTVVAAISGKTEAQIREYAKGIAGSNVTDYVFNMNSKNAVTELAVLFDELSKQNIKPWVAINMVDSTAADVSALFANKLAFIGDLLNNYDVYGLEIDIVSNIGLFDSIEYLGLSMLTKFITDVKALVDANATKFGHDVMLSTVVASTPQINYDFGIDVTEWAAKKYIDRVAVKSSNTISDNNISVKLWDSVMRPLGIEVAACIETNLTSTVKHDYETYAASAANYLSQGASKIYLNDFGGITKTYDAADKSATTNTDLATDAGYWNALSNFGSYDKLMFTKRKMVVTVNEIQPDWKKVYNILPLSITKGKGGALRMPMGDVYEGSVATFKFSVVPTSLTAADKIPTVYINSTAATFKGIEDCSTGIVTDKVLAYEIPASAYDDMYVVAEIQVASAATIKYAEIYIDSTNAIAPEPEYTPEIIPEEDRGAFVGGSHTYKGVTIPTSLYVPKTYNELNDYALLIYFHNVGGRNNEDPYYDGGKGHGIVKKILEIEGENFIVFAPRCLENDYWTPEIYSEGVYKFSSDNTSKSMSVVIDYVYKHILKGYSIDKSRVYVAGDSMGGGGTWDFITRCPGLVTAAFPVAGYNDPTQVYNISDDVKLWISHGMYDKTVNVKGDRAAYAVLKNLGRDVRYTEYDTTKDEVKEAFGYDPNGSTNWEHYAWNAAYNDTEMVKWLLAQRKDEDGEDRVQRFDDVPTDSTYYKAVKYVTDLGLFQGVSDKEFAPEGYMNRAMFVTVLGRYENVDQYSYTTYTFEDIAKGEYYTGYVAWASRNKIVNGYSDKQFAPFDNISIAQACLILGRMVEFKNAGESTQLKLTDYRDYYAVPDYAKEAMEWAITNGIYLGTMTSLNSNLYPNNPATRAQVAAMFYNFNNMFGND